MMPPDRKMTVEKSTARVAVLTESSCRRVNRNAITTVAKTSKKPSTRRCTTHQRQYSAVMMWLRCPYINPAPKKGGMAIDETRKNTSSERPSSLRLSAGFKARYMRPSQKVKPTKSKICQKRPKSTYSYPCAPNQNQYLPKNCLMPSHSPVSEPTTTSSTAANNRLTPSLCPFGSYPLTAGAMKRPVAS